MFWDAVLSRSPRRIRAAVRPLDAKARAALIAHLLKMITETGWLPEQQASAQAALDVIGPEHGEGSPDYQASRPAGE